MQKAYTALAHTIAGLVVLQAAFMVYAVAGQSKWLEDGGVLDQAVIDDAREGGDSPFPEAVGYMLHSISGAMLIPVVGLVLLIIAFFAKIPGGVKYAAILFVLILVQGHVLGFAAKDVPFLGALHGVNALALFAVAVYAGIRATRATVPAAT